MKQRRYISKFPILLVLFNDLDIFFFIKKISKSKTSESSQQQQLSHN